MLNTYSMNNNIPHMINQTQLNDFYKTKVFLNTMKDQNGDWCERK